MQTIINKLKKGSILAYSLIIMSIMLATALSIASVSVLERKNASSTGSSVQAFAVADSGTEIILQKVRRDGHTIASTLTTNLPAGWSRDDSSGTCIINGSIASGEVEILLKDETDAIISDCDSPLSVQSVKSTGKYLGTTRAVEVAVAKVGDAGIGTCYDPNDMLYIQFATTCPSGFTQCSQNDIWTAGRKGCLPNSYQYFMSGSTAPNAQRDAKGCLSENGWWLIASPSGSMYGGSWIMEYSNPAAGGCSASVTIFDACCHTGN